MQSKRTITLLQRLVRGMGYRVWGTVDPTEQIRYDLNLLQAEF